MKNEVSEIVNRICQRMSDPYGWLGEIDEQPEQDCDPDKEYHIEDERETFNRDEF